MFTHECRKRLKRIQLLFNVALIIKYKWTDDHAMLSIDGADIAEQLYTLDDIAHGPCSGIIQLCIHGIQCQRYTKRQKHCTRHAKNSSKGTCTDRQTID